MNKREAELATYKRLKEENARLQQENRWLADMIATNKRILGMKVEAHANAQPAAASER